MQLFQKLIKGYRVNKPLHEKRQTLLRQNQGQTSQISKDKTRANFIQTHQHRQIYKKYLKIHIDAYFHRKVDDMLADTYRYKELAFLAQQNESIQKYKAFDQIKNQIGYAITCRIKGEYMFPGCFHPENNSILSRYNKDKKNLQKKKYSQISKGKNSMYTPSTMTAPSKTIQTKNYPQKLLQKTENDSNHSIMRLANNIDIMINTNCRQRKGQYEANDSFQLDKIKKNLFFSKQLSEIKFSTKEERLATNIKLKFNLNGNSNKKTSHHMKQKSVSKQKNKINSVKYTQQEQSYGLKSFKKPKAKFKNKSKDRLIQNNLLKFQLFNFQHPLQQQNQDYQGRLFPKTPQPYGSNLLIQRNHRLTQNNSKHKQKHGTFSQRTSIKGCGNFSKSPTPRYQSPRQSLVKRKKLKSEGKVQIEYKKLMVTARKKKVK